MVGRKQTEIERLKNYLSRQEDVYRLAYRRDSISYPRSFVIVATSNDKGALPNEPEWQPALCRGLVPGQCR